MDNIMDPFARDKALEPEDHFDDFLTKGQKINKLKGKFEVKSAKGSKGNGNEP